MTSNITPHARKINAEALKDIKKQIFTKHTDALRKTLVGLNNTRAEAVYIINESFNKMTSPSFWAMTWVQYYKEGKSWSDAVTYDVNKDFDKKIVVIKRDFGKATADIKNEIARQKKSKSSLEMGIKVSKKQMKSIEGFSVKLMDGLR